MRRTPRPVRRDRRGVAAIEFAVILPVALIALFFTHEVVHVLRAYMRVESASLQIGQIISQCEQVSAADEQVLKDITKRILGSYAANNAQWALRINAFGRGSDNKDIVPWSISQSDGAVAGGQPALAVNSKGSAMPAGYTMARNVVLFRTEIFLSVDRTPLMRGVSLLAMNSRFESAYAGRVHGSRVANTDGLKAKGAAGCLT